MRTPKLWLAAGPAAGATALAFVAGRAEGRRAEARVVARVAALAASVDRLRQEAPPPRVVEYHTPREVVARPGGADDAPAADERPGEGAAGGPFEEDDVRAYAAGRGPHPIERLFEREVAARAGEPEARRRALVSATSGALAGDDDVREVECRASSCRVDATFASVEASNDFARRVFLASTEGPPAFRHGGVMMPVQEASGDRHHTVFYVMRAPGDDEG
jgi:hypothetical protein